MKNFLRQLFGLDPVRPTGSLKSPVDVRLVSTAQFQSPVALPTEMETPLPPTEDQGQKNKCVGCAFHKLVELYFLRKGIVVDLSDDDAYEQCKTRDGIPDVPGTYPVVGAQVCVNPGIATVEAYNSKDPKKIAESRALHRVSGYATVPNTYDAICQAIFQNGAVTASVDVDANWFRGIITKVLQSVGRHDLVWNGFRRGDMSLKGMNSWGVAWIGYIAGKVSPSVKPGHFEALWSDISDSISDIFVLADVPAELILQAKGYEYRFTKNLSIGSKGYDVTKLQDRLRKEGFFNQDSTGTFGSITQAAVKAYQTAHGIQAIGSVGPLTRAELNKKAMPLVNTFAKAIQDHEGYYAPAVYPPLGSRSYRNCNPGNFKIVSTILTPYMKKLGATGTDAQGFVIFPSYEVGFAALVTFITDACNDKLTSYRSTMPLYTEDPKVLGFFNVYAPASDNNATKAYAQDVAAKMGVSLETTLKEIL